MIQRNFGYATTDVRLCYSIIKETLYKPEYTKVVFILHSQGGIEGSLVIDWLLQELPQELMAKLEVYTFGNASNHFNNPHRHLSSQMEAQGRPLEGGGATNTAATTTTTTTTNGSSISSSNGGAHPPTQRRGNVPVARNAPRLLTETSSSRPSEISDRVIGHIEHYAHTTDFVALWGVLHFATTSPLTKAMPRYIGRVFSRTSARGGHQFCQHYLDGMFPLAHDRDTGALTGCDEAANDFMESEILIGRDGDESADVRHSFEKSWVAALEGAMDGTSERHTSPVEVEIHSQSPILSRTGSLKKVRVKDLSRLWLYRNGRSPDDKPSIVRSTTHGLEKDDATA